MGGVFWSRFVDYTIYAPGNNNKLLIINGGTLDLLSLFNQTILNVVEKFEDVVIGSTNRTILINVMLILAVIIVSILVLCLRQHCQKKPPENNFNNVQSDILIVSPTSNDKSLSKNNSIYAEGNLV